MYHYVSEVCAVWQLESRLSCLQQSPKCTFIRYTRLCRLSTFDWEPSQSSQTKVQRATDSSFTLVGVHQCGILMDVGMMTGCLAAYVSTTSANTCGSTKVALSTATVVRGNISSD